MRIGVLHPGEMGVSVAQALADAGHSPCWVRTGRSPATVQRAAQFVGLDSLEAMLKEVQGIISVCPPHAALAQAQAVKDAGYEGVYVDANAVAPATASQIATVIGDGYVDGGIIGPPAVRAGTTRLYLSGPRAQEVAGWFTGSLLSAVGMAADAELVAASSVKMAYAAYTKGSSALLLAVNALAQALGVRETLAAEWSLSQPGLDKRSEQTASGTSRKAWRFVGEMQEIAQTFTDAGLPGDFHHGAAEIYARMAGLKDLPPSELAVVLQHLRASR